MDLNTWLDSENGKGRLTRLATHFGLTRSAVSQWRTNGVPPGRMKAVRDFTEGAVTLDEMLPSPPELIGGAEQDRRDLGPLGASDPASPTAEAAEVRDAA